MTRNRRHLAWSIEGSRSICGCATCSPVAVATAITSAFSSLLAGRCRHCICGRGGSVGRRSGNGVCTHTRWQRAHGNEISAASSREPAPQHYPAAHLIAHSFGTWLSGTALRRWFRPNLIRPQYLGVLVGCVLPCRFPWRRIVRERRDAYRSVRNEVGEGDWVVWAVNLVHPIVPEMGGAGLIGFFGSWFHRSFSPKGLRVFTPLPHRSHCTDWHATSI